MQTRKIIILGFSGILVFYLSDSLVGYLLSEDSAIAAMTYTRLIGMILIIVMTYIYLRWERTGLKAKPQTASGTMPKPVSERMDPMLLKAILNQLKLPLTVIVGFAALMKNPDMDPKTVKMYSEYIRHNSHSLLPLLDNIIDLFSIESDQIKITTERCDISRVLEEVISTFEVQNIQDNSGEGLPGNLVRGGHTGQLIIRSDRKKLKQVLSNLITNSVQLSDLSEIEIGYEIRNKYLEFFIKDHLHDLSLDKLDSIYSDYRSDNAIQNQSLIVAALRLTIAQRLIHAMDGEIWTKKSKENGSDTYFKIPLEIITKSDKPETMEERRSMPVWDNYKLLIAEDIKSNYIYLKEVLRPTRIQISWAKNGKEAVEEIANHRDIDLVLMDALMPEMDGFEAARNIKKLRSRLPIIVQTAYSLEGEPEEALSYFDDYLTKPIWSSDLIRVLSRFLSPQDVTPQNPDHS